MKSELLKRMVRLKCWSRRNAKCGKHISILTTPETMVKQWESQSGICVACGNSGLTFSNSRYDHDHQTGEGRGFIHHACNSAEGHLKDLSDDSLLHFVKWMRPHLF